MVEGSRFLESLQNASIKVYVLEEDIKARGLGGQISDSVVRLQTFMETAPFYCRGHAILKQ